MTREESIERIRQRINDMSWCIDDEDKEALETLIPELVESKDERIRKELISLVRMHVSPNATCLVRGGSTTRQQAESYLEKQKEPHYTKRNALFDKCVENCDPAVMKRVSDEVDAMLEKEQKPIDPSDDELQRHQDELYDFKVFAAKQAKEHHISFVHDFEWNNFCDELLSFFYEKHTTDGKALLHVAEKSYQIGLRDGRMEQQPEPFSCSHEKGVRSEDFDTLFDEYCDLHPDGLTLEECGRFFYEKGKEACKESICPQSKRDGGDDYKKGYAKGRKVGFHEGTESVKSIEWNEEDERMRQTAIEACKTIAEKYELSSDRFYKCKDWLEYKLKLKYLRPQSHWKPSEEQMDSLHNAIVRCKGYSDTDHLPELYEDLKKL